MVLGDPLAAANTNPGKKTAEYVKERKEYGKICKSPVPPTGDKCKDAQANLDRLKLCLKLREEFGLKWFNDGEPGHAIENANTAQAILKLEETVFNCRNSCP